MLLNILSNALVLAFEVAAIALSAWLALTYPIAFSLLTAALAFGLGLMLEYARLQNEYTFYFGRPLVGRSFAAMAYAAGETIIKSLLAGLAALLTFSGTDRGRLTYVAIVFAATLFAGTSLLRWLKRALGAKPQRWGYFRLAAALGLVFSSGVTLLDYFGFVQNPGLSDIVRTAIWDTAAKPPVGEASELLFKLKQYLDEAIARYLSIWVGESASRLLSIVLSVNMLTGFVASIYALVIASACAKIDDWLP
jgi:hypothetical protein